MRADLGAGVTFSPAGRFSADDGVNRYGGRYRATRDGVVIGDLAGTLVGYAGHDRSVEAAVRGIGSLHGAASTISGRSTLTMRTSGTTLTFTRADVDPGFTGAGDASGASGASASPSA